MSRPAVISCRVFGGRSPLTGKPVGERHRWSGGAWGKGRCEFCGRYLEDVLEKPPKTPLTLAQAIDKGAEPKGLDQATDQTPENFDWRAFALGKPQPQPHKAKPHRTGRA